MGILRGRSGSGGQGSALSSRREAGGLRLGSAGRKMGCRKGGARWGPVGALTCPISHSHHGTLIGSS